MEAEARAVGSVSVYALDIIHSPELTTLGEATLQELIRLRVQDLGLHGISTTEQVIKRAIHSRIGNRALELCRIEVGLHQRIADTEQALGDIYYIMHEPITGRGGNQYVLELVHSWDGLRLDAFGPNHGWSPECWLVFALGKIIPINDVQADGQKLPETSFFRIRIGSVGELGLRPNRR